MIKVSKFKDKEKKKKIPYFNIPFPIFIFSYIIIFIRSYGILFPLSLVYTNLDYRNIIPQWQVSTIFSMREWIFTREVEFWEKLLDIFISTLYRPFFYEFSWVFININFIDSHIYSQSLENINVTHMASRTKRELWVNISSRIR